MTASSSMPYNTRHKSLSLPSLGIHVPASHPPKAPGGAATTDAHSTVRLHGHQNPHRHSPPRSAMTASSTTSPSHRSRPSFSSKREMQTKQHPFTPNKKLKRSHCPTRPNAEPTPSVSASPEPSSPPNRNPNPNPNPRNRNRKPRDDDSPRQINLATIKDEIVEAVILRLQQTGNKPHLVKELAMCLIQQLKIVQLSANPTAIIASRLAAFLKRPCWSDTSPCPIAKELETVHPRRTYFYLTTCPALAFVPPTERPTTIITLPPRTAIVTPPSLSSHEDDEDEHDGSLLSDGHSGIDIGIGTGIRIGMSVGIGIGSGSDSDRDERLFRSRGRLSPSPEVDLSAPDFDDLDDDHSQPATPVGSMPIPPVPKQSHRQSHVRAARAPSPALEKDEREFTQTATGLQKRKLTGDLLEPPIVVEAHMDIDADISRDEVLFGEARGLAPPQPSLPIPFASSPAIRPSLPKKETETDAWASLDGMVGWDKSPEKVELDELDGLMDQF